MMSTHRYNTRFQSKLASKKTLVPVVRIRYNTRYQSGITLKTITSLLHESYEKSGIARIRGQTVLFNYLQEHTQFLKRHEKLLATIHNSIKRYLAFEIPFARECERIIHGKVDAEYNDSLIQLEQSMKKFASILNQ